MHTDSYILFQLEAKGYRQKIFRMPDAVLHEDHERPDRTEPIPFEFHLRAYSKILEND